jgi:hypothetical protein
MNQRESDLDRYFGTFYLDERIILQWIIRKREPEAWTGLIWLRIRLSGMIF